MSTAPSRLETHYNAMMTNFLQAEIQDDDAFVARKVFQSIPVQFQSNNWYSVVDDDFNRSVAQPLAPATETPGANFHLRNDNTYLCVVHGVHFDLADQIEKNVDAQINMHEMIARLLKRNLLIRQELDWANKAFRANIWQGFDYNGVVQDFDCSNLAYSSGQWDTANSDPVVTVDYLRANVHRKIGFRPNVGVCTDDVYRALKNHPLVIARFSNGPVGQSLQNGLVTKEMVARVLELDELLVCDAIYNSAEEGETAKTGYILPSGMLLLYRPSAPGLMVACAGATFEWVNYANGMAMAVEDFRLERTMVQRYRARTSYDMQVTEPRLGVFMTNILAKPNVSA